MTFSRRRAFIRSTGSILAAASVSTAVRPAQFVYRFGHVSTVDDPWHVRAVEMARNVKRETNGRLEIQIYPNSMLGSDSAMLSQVRLGALQFSANSGALLSSFAPAASIASVPYAFRTERQAVDAQFGELGAAIRKEIELKTNLHVFPMILNAGFKNISSGTHPIRTADDMVGFKVRTGSVSMFVDFYKTLGALPVSLSVGEAYTALQTRLVDGQDSGYIYVETQHFYEVQKYLSVMDFIWIGAHFYANRDAWNALPSDIQTILTNASVVYGKEVASDYFRIEDALVDKLKRQGMIFNQADRQSFKARLTPFYARLKELYGPSLWAILQKYSGTLG